MTVITYYEEFPIGKTSKRVAFIEQYLDKGAKGKMWRYGYKVRFSPIATLVKSGLYVKPTPKRVREACAI